MKRRQALKTLATAAAALPLMRESSCGRTSFPPIRSSCFATSRPRCCRRPSAARARTKRSTTSCEWIREYKEGVALSHGYGEPRLVKSGPSPAPGYSNRSRALQQAAQARGGRFGALPIEVRRELLDAAFKAADVRNLPGRPDGKHVVADLMAHYFRSSAANDLCYNARIGRNTYRAIRVTTVRPQPLNGGRRALAPAADMPVHESDICVIGGGITAVMLIERLAELKPNLKITAVEAGRSIFDRENRGTYHRRALEYGEHPWHDDYIEDQQAKGMISMTMAVGGQALHWGGACNRFSEEDLRLKSMYGLADDWPIDWAELEKFYVQAERRLNVAGDPSPYAEDRRSGPYPQPAMPLSYNLQVLKKWAEQSGLKFSPLPMSRNVNAPFDGRGACGLYDTCGDVCPTGARYSPDYTYQQLIAAKKITLHDRMLVRKLVLADGKDTIAAAHGYHQDRPNEMTEYRAKLFVLASGQCWSPHLLLLSANSRFPNGIANRSGLVGRYMNGHKFISAQATIDEETFPGQNMTHSLISREYLPLRDRTSRSCGTTRACGKARPARNRGCDRPTAGCCSATSCSTTGDRARSRAARCGCARITIRIRRPTAG